MVSGMILTINPIQDGGGWGGEGQKGPPNSLSPVT